MSVLALPLATLLLASVFQLNLLTIPLAFLVMPVLLLLLVLMEFARVVAELHAWFLPMIVKLLPENAMEETAPLLTSLMELIALT